MLHTKFLGGVFIMIYGYGGHLGHVTDADEQTPDHDHPISSTCEPSAQVSYIALLSENLKSANLKTICSIILIWRILSCFQKVCPLVTAVVVE